MGNKTNFSKDNYYMHVQLIGLNMENFYQEIKKETPQKNIKKFWEFSFNKNPESIEKEINNYFDNLKLKFQNRITDEFRETLIFKIDNFNPEIDDGKENDFKTKIIESKEVDIILTRMNELSQAHYTPFILLLSTDENRLKLEINENDYKNLDPRLIIPSYYNEDPIYIDEIIDPILLRFCSIYNELGDRFTIGKKENKCNYDLIYKYFPFNINIACIGRVGTGKSTGVNRILQEYKAKECSKRQTKQLTYYQVSDQPVRIFDIPGFENEKTVKHSVEIFKSCSGKINKIKDNLHIILYFFNFLEEIKFSEFEKPMLEEIVKHKKSRIIYIITHSDMNIKSEEKSVFISQINEGVFNIIKQNEETDMLEANFNNVVFVNFKLDKVEPFGVDELFQKIYDFFIESEDYKTSLKELNPEIIKKDAEQLRQTAKSILIYHKIGAGVVGMIPGLDFLVQKYLIKKDAIRKVGEIFGIDVKIINEDSKINQTKKLTKDITSAIDSETFEEEEEKDLMKEKENKTNNLKKAFYAAGEAGICYGGKKVYDGIKLFSKEKDVSTLITASASKTNSVVKIAAQQANSVTWLGRIFTNSFQTATQTAVKATELTGDFSNISVNANNVKNAGFSLTATGASFTIIGSLIGAGIGGYFTHRFCEDLIDKFEKYYIDNVQEISNSYKKAAEYFEKNAKEIRDSYNKPKI